MFKHPTTIILGAGASAEFGLPTGAMLLSRLLEMQPYSLSRDFRRGGNYRNYDIASAIMESYSAFPTQNLNDDQLINKVKNTFEKSIDLFSYNNESVLETAKFYTAWSVQASMMAYEMKKGNFGDYYTIHSYRDDWFKPYVDGRRNWIAELIRKLTEDAESASDIDPKIVKIVSFNYDQIFKHAATNFIQSSERFEAAWEDIMPDIHHVYGSIEFLENIHARKMAEQRGRIAFIKEVSDQDNHIKIIRQILSESEDIYCCGFAFDRRNVELIGLNSTNANIYTVNYDGNYELSARLAQLGVSRENIMSGSASSPMPLGVAAEQGFFSLHELRR